MTIDKRIQDLTTQAADADLMNGFLAGQLVRTNGPTDDSELPTPDAAEVESARMVPTTVRFSAAQREKLEKLAKARKTDVSSLLRDWVDHQLEASEHPERKLITLEEAVEALRNLPHSA
ncbi:regulator [Nocardia yunnanensis]|uniref:Regulator n=1 Tax=Nocardia yunnanensis TaxID=2382165 RepID=A0A386ZP01_9NOCA|nr:regulator [Nocardia yunnanensis]AYF78285.1 regulator [Nocardia yunnanensis]